MTNTTLWLWGVACAIALPSCSTLPSAPPKPIQAEQKLTAPEDPASLHAVYAQLAKTGGQVMAVDPKSSVVRIYAFRSGPAAKMGHNHVLSAPQFTGFLFTPPGRTSASRFDLEFRLDQLEIDQPALRSATGGSFASTLSTEEIQGTREHMLGSNGLQADRYPLVHLQSLQISGESPKFAAQVHIDMHGRAHDVWVPLTVEESSDHLFVSGSLVLRQSDFGIKPYSILGGLMAVQDEVIVEFKLAASSR